MFIIQEKMDWKKNYDKKVLTAEEAINKIKSNNRVVVSHAAGEPKHLIETLVKNASKFKNVEIVHMVTLGKALYAQPDMSKHFFHNALFLSGATRNTINSGYGDFTPSFFFEIPQLFLNGSLPIDVALIQVSTPDSHGYCSYGVSCDYTKPASENAKIVIAQINNNTPRVLGDNFIHIDDIDFIVEKDEEVTELTPPKIGKIEEKIGKLCSNLIKDGDTLQLGIGAIPDAVLKFLFDKKDLGIHSEMISDGVVELIENGIITNKKKKLHKNKCIVSFLMGTKKLYDFVDNNPIVELHPVNYVNNPLIIAKNESIVSINSALQIDLMGQVNAESLGSKQFSGTGGQVDFIRGASLAKNGISIIAMPSTTANEKISKIVFNLDFGATITTSRNDVDYIITEYGIAKLKGKTLKERAKLLINIAHPKFREELLLKAKEKFVNF